MTVSVAFPTVIDKVIAALGAASSLSGIRVFDGAEIDGSYPKDAIAIGGDASFGDSPIMAGHFSDVPFTFGENHDEEGQIACSLWSQDGSSKFSPLRIRAFALLSAIDTVIRADTTFTGTVLYAYLQSGSVSYRSSTQGNAVIITFTINYKAQS